MGTKNKFCQVLYDLTEEKNSFRTY